MFIKKILKYSLMMVCTGEAETIVISSNNNDHDSIFRNTSFLKTRLQRPSSFSCWKNDCFQIVALGKNFWKIMINNYLKKKTSSVPEYDYLRWASCGIRYVAANSSLLPENRPAARYVRQSRRKAAPVNLCFAWAAPCH